MNSIAHHSYRYYQNAVTAEVLGFLSDIRDYFKRYFGVLMIVLPILAGFSSRIPVIDIDKKIGFCFNTACFKSNSRCHLIL